jgi:hypothetical protein
MTSVMRNGNGKEEAMGCGHFLGEEGEEARRRHGAEGR